MLRTLKDGGLQLYHPSDLFLPFTHGHNAFAL